MKLLTQAMNVLKSFYEKNAKGVALAQQEPVGPPPPAGFKAYENNAGGSGVIAMITQIINDAKAMEAETIHAKNADIVSKEGDKATAEGDKATAETNLDATNTELEQLANEKADL